MIDEIYMTAIMRLKICFVRFIIVFCLLLGGACKKNKVIPLPSGLTFCSFESASGPKHFVARNDGKTIIPPQIQSLKYNRTAIWGYIEPINDSAFDVVPEGWFFINSKTGLIDLGLSLEKLNRILLDRADDSSITIK